jgi:hypothetical protein
MLSKQIYWEFFNKCLPINKQRSTRPTGRLPQTLCTGMQHGKAHPQPSKESHHRSDRNTLPILPHPIHTCLGKNEKKNILKAIVLWTLWKAHNEWTHHNYNLPSAAQTNGLIITEIKRYVHSQIARLKSRPPKTQEEKSKLHSKLDSISSNWSK